MCETEKDVVGNIISNYRQNEMAIVEQLAFKVDNHGTTIGGFREDIWRKMFQQIIPKKFVIEQSVFIIDSNGKVSREVDLAIFDETYTPYIFRYGRIKFIPIEAVAVVVECKSTSMDDDTLSKWAASITNLTTSLESYTRVAGRIIVGKEEKNSTQTQTRPLRILCCLNTDNVNVLLENGEMLFDVIIKTSLQKSGLLKIEFDKNKKNLQDWYLALNHADWQKTDREINEGTGLEDIKLEDYAVEGVSLLSFNLQLNQLLMLINNPIPFPHMAYAKMFNRHSKGGKTHE
ncbi:hypothetical protein NIA71_06045 [Ihubacter massiliensis]|uniref:DUF6602 domain-containing protein n=1 Tax=Hominibacterium faecale TaxID=2839743 RepID=A0A9J6QUI1_9FIRM|nr:MULTISPECIES: DUF6602 domain-containing protein [Eubacteriales Family XIII. Incertae Sedis]MCO7121515.1 hypothetical protein [Ihubacter massiliensis]MCU7378495.1 hypothetical protein [Hominibacterium faecale]